MHADPLKRVPLWILQSFKAALSILIDSHHSTECGNQFGVWGHAVYELINADHPRRSSPPMARPSSSLTSSWRSL